MTNAEIHYFRFHKDGPVQSIQPSVIPYYDLTLVLEGSLEYRINNRKVTVRAGDAVLMPPDTRRERFFGEGRATYASYNFRTEEALPLPLLIEGGVGQEIRMMIYACDEIDRDHGAYARASFGDLLSAIVNSLLSAVTRSGFSALTERILEYIRENYRRPLTLKSIADAMAYSVQHCDQVFKKDVGVSVVRYLIDYRVARVKEFLIENVLSLKEIAERTGFGESNYLSRQFRQRTGYTPLRFRKEFNR